MTIKITYDQALSSLFRAIADRGRDFVYPDHWKTTDTIACRNFDETTGAPLCIAGYVYWLNGKTYDPTNQTDQESWRSCTVTTLAGTDKLDIDVRTVILLQTAQSEQDRGMSWGTAVVEAQRAVEAWDRKKANNND